MKTIVSLDLDGTLWEMEEIPASALEAIHKARANGHLIFANTGRARSTAMESLKDVPLDGYVFSSGSEIWMDGKPIFYKPMPADQIRDMVNTLSDRDVAFVLEGSNETFLNDLNRKFFDEHFEANRISSAFANLPGIEEMADKDYGEIMKVTVNLKNDQNVDDMIEKEGLVFTPFNVVREGWNSGELTNPDYTKGTALKIIQDILGGETRTMALGDSENDIPMLDAADVAIVMDNGTPDAKAHGDWITTDLHDNGLYNAFKHAGLLDED